MRRNLPNYITGSRFFMAIAFFIVLAFFRAGEKPTWPVLEVAFAIFLLAIFSDAVDGYLARRMGRITSFGRIADPFVDKILVCGAFVFFIGNSFLINGGGADAVNVTGLRTWMVVLIIARELLVTGMRSFSESHGIPFPASWSGKLKMFLQCLAICWILVYLKHWTGHEWARQVRDILVWVMVAFTAVSGLTYIDRARRLIRLEA